MTRKAPDGFTAALRESTRQPLPLVLWEPFGEGKHPTPLDPIAELNAIPITGMARVNERLRQLTPAVVLILFPRTITNEQLQQIEQFIGEQHDCVWIALLHDMSALQGQLLALIFRSFFDFLHLPLDPRRLGMLLGHARGMLVLQQQLRQLSEPADNEVPLMLGSSPLMARFKRQVRRVASTQHTVLICGESGTGKELVSQALHRLSDRRTMPIDALNCAAFPANLIQSELFGHEKGAFTDAHQRKIGRFEACHGGTLFLDEIGDMPLEQQTNLLRVLEQGSIRRVGGTTDIPVDVRIIAATHIDLEQAVAEKRFRQDLYYRLYVVRLDIPPLRERSDDIELLARHFYQQLLQNGQRRPKGFSQAALSVIRSHHWPGNVRELLNRVQHAMVLAEGQLIQPRDLGLEQRCSSRMPISIKAARECAERQAIDNAMRQHGNNITQAARELNVSRITLYRLLEKHHIDTH